MSILLLKEDRADFIDYGKVIDIVDKPGVSYIQFPDIMAQGFKYYAGCSSSTPRTSPASPTSSTRTVRALP